MLGAGWVKSPTCPTKFWPFSTSHIFSTSRPFLSHRVVSNKRIRPLRLKLDRVCRTQITFEQPKQLGWNEMSNRNEENCFSTWCFKKNAHHFPETRTAHLILKRENHGGVGYNHGFQTQPRIKGCGDMAMMTSSNGNNFRVTGHLCGEFTGHDEFHARRPVARSFDVFFDMSLNKRLSKQ